MTKGIAIFYFILFESLATQLLHRPYHFDECSVSLNVFELVLCSKQ